MRINLHSDLAARKYVNKLVVSGQFSSAAEICKFFSETHNARLIRGAYGWKAISFKKKRDFTMFVLRTSE